MLAPLLLQRTVYGPLSEDAPGAAEETGVLMEPEEESIQKLFESQGMRIIIPEDIERDHEDPIAWWVEYCLFDIEHKARFLDMPDYVLCLLATASVENMYRKSGAIPGKPSQVDWSERVRNLKRNGAPDGS